MGLLCFSGVFFIEVLAAFQRFFQLEIRDCGVADEDREKRREQERDRREDILYSIISDNEREHEKNGKADGKRRRSLYDPTLRYLEWSHVVLATFGLVYMFGDRVDRFEKERGLVPVLHLHVISFLSDLSDKLGATA